MFLLKQNIHTTTMKTKTRFTFLIVILIPFALLSQLRSLASNESNMVSSFTSSLHPLEFSSSISRQQCCSMDYIEYMQFGFRFQILLFTTSVHFSTKTLAYLAYKAQKAFKAFMAFKRSRFCPIQNYRSITSFCVDWPRTIRLVYASISILSVCAIMLQVIVIQTR